MNSEWQIARQVSTTQHKSKHVREDCVLYTAAMEIRYEIQNANVCEMFEDTSHARSKICST